MKNVQVLKEEMKNLEVTLGEKYDKVSTDHVCMYCWQPTETNHCNDCDTVTDIENDPFLNMNEQVEYAMVVGG
jgi:hypothetical protein